MASRGPGGGGGLSSEQVSGFDHLWRCRASGLSHAAAAGRTSRVAKSLLVSICLLSSPSHRPPCLPRNRFRVHSMHSGSIKMTVSATLLLLLVAVHSAAAFQYQDCTSGVEPDAKLGSVLISSCPDAQGDRCVLDRGTNASITINFDTGKWGRDRLLLR